MVTDILLSVGRLFALTAIGFALFKIRWLAKHATGVFLFLVLNILMPMYFVHSIPTQWADGLAAGWHWMLIFVGAYLVSLVVQFALGKLLINRVPILTSEHPRELLVLFAMHNAGYIPLPILAAIAPPAVTVYATFYVMAFILCFFTIAVWIIQGSAHGGKIVFRPNAPMVGILIGLLLAITGIYDRFPPWLRVPFEGAELIALDAVMILLGAILASLPAGSFQFRREFGGLVLAKMVLYPAVVLGLMALLPLRNLAPELAGAIKLSFVLQAVVPPATNIMVVTRAYGTETQVRYAGGAMMVTYLASLVLIPLFMILATLLL